MFYYIIFLKIKDCNYRLGACLVAQLVKNLPAIQETWVRSLGREDPLEKGMAHSSILAWRIPWQKGLVSYSPWGCKESDMTERLTISCHLLLYKHLPLRPVNPGLFLTPWNRLYSPWNSPGQNTRVGSLSHFQGIFPTQGSNPGLLYYRWILYCLSHQGSPLSYSKYKT